jgi:putative DNA methylase
MTPGNGLSGRPWKQSLKPRKNYSLKVVAGQPPANAEDGTKISRGAFRCIMSDTPITYSYIDDEANAGRMGARLIAVVAEGVRARVYLSPTEEQEQAAQSAHYEWRPESPCRGTFASNAQGRIYGFKVFGDYFTSRQLVALNVFSDLAGRVQEKCTADALAASMSADPKALRDGGRGAFAYGEAMSVYSTFGVARSADAWSSIVTWRHQADATRNTFARQGIPMTWDFAEANPFSDSCGNWTGNAVE